jgi:hypothetical protein
MALKVSIKHPGFGPDSEFEVPGVGMVKNGGSITLNEEDEGRFFSRTGMKVKDYYKDTEDVDVSGTSDAKLPANQVPAPNASPDAVDADKEGDS